MSQSLYKSLKANYPESQLDVMAPDWCRPLLARMPEVDNAIRMPLGHGEFNLKSRWALGRALKGQYDWAIVQPNSLKSSLIPLFAGIKRRTGWKGESRYGLLNDLRSNKTDFPLMVERYVALSHPKVAMNNAAALPAIAHPELIADPANQQQALERLHLSLERPILAICPGAEFGPAKRWPEQHYAEVARHWINQHQGQVWIFGSNKDESVATALFDSLSPEQQPHCQRLTGQTNLAEAIDLMALSRLAISNDSGLMHIAAALKLPLIAIYGSTSPSYTPPLAEQVAVLHTDIECRPCFKRECPLGHLKCLKELDASRAIAATDSLMQGQAHDAPQ
jgi:heptosyltransferase-2